MYTKIYAAAQYFGSDELRDEASKDFERLAGLHARTEQFLKAVAYMYDANVDDKFKEVALELIASRKIWLISLRADQVISDLGISHEILQRVGRPSGAMKGRGGVPDAFGVYIETQKPMLNFESPSSSTLKKFGRTLY